MQLLAALVLLFAHPAHASVDPANVAQVKIQLTQDLKNPQHYVNRWIRMITESSSRQDGRWDGISKDYQLVKAGSYSEVGSDDSFEYMMIYEETKGFHRGSETTPLVFTFMAGDDHGKLVLSSFSFQSLNDGGVLNRKPGFYDVSPTEQGISQELKDELVLELLKTVSDATIPKYEGDNGATVNYVLETLPDHAKNAKSEIHSYCEEKPGFKGIAICHWGYKAGNGGEMLSFEVYDDNYVNGQQVGKFNQVLPNTVSYLKQ